jgi:hypothetical protein
VRFVGVSRSANVVCRPESAGLAGWLAGQRVEEEQANQRRGLGGRCGTDAACHHDGAVQRAGIGLIGAEAGYG